MPNVFVTGGAGFIGSYVVARMLDEGHTVTVFDNLSTGRADNIRRFSSFPRFRFVEGDLLDIGTLREAIRGHDLIWHLAANTDIRHGVSRTDADLKNCVIATWNVLEAVRDAGITELLFASSGVVYGDVQQNPLLETAGPLLPVSLYGAGKLSCEAFIAAYCAMFGLRAWMFRFANVIGRGTRHGVVYDFVRKLIQTPDVLEVLGDGNQLKPYFLVDECVEAMLHAYQHAPRTAEHPCDVFNLGPASYTSVRTIAEIVREEMRLPEARIHYTGGKRGWSGDAPVILMGVDKMRALGWSARHTSDEAVRIAAREIIDEARAESHARALDRSPGGAVDLQT
jgi:UDP-glucose 4-epimerase